MLGSFRRVRGATVSSAVCSIAMASSPVKSPKKVKNEDVPDFGSSEILAETDRIVALHFKTFVTVAERTKTVGLLKAIANLLKDVSQDALIEVYSADGVKETVATRMSWIGNDSVFAFL